MDTREKIEADIWQKASFNREHIHAFLNIVPSNNSEQVVIALKQWMQRLHENPQFTAIHFNEDQTNLVISDLEYYGFVTHNVLLGGTGDIMDTHL